MARKLARQNKKTCQIGLTRKVQDCIIRNEKDVRAVAKLSLTSSSVFQIQDYYTKEKINSQTYEDF